MSSRRPDSFANPYVNISLDGAATNQALLDLTAGAAGDDGAGVLAGDVKLSGDSTIEFAAGQIKTIAAFSDLKLAGADAFIETSGAPGSNSALHGLAQIVGDLDLEDGATIATSGNLDLSGQLALSSATPDGESQFRIGGRLTNSGGLYIGGALSSSWAAVTVDALTNTGTINIVGLSTSASTLNVAGSAAGFGTAGLVTGDVQVGSYGAIVFASGQITAIAANSKLSLAGSNCFIADRDDLGSSSALLSASGLSTDNCPSISARLSRQTLEWSTSEISTWTPQRTPADRTSRSAARLVNRGTLSIGNNLMESSDGVAAPGPSTTRGPST